MTRLKKGDRVVVLAGSDRGKTGRLLAVDPRKSQVLVEGVNMKWKHVRKSQQNPQGGRTQREYPVHVSNVAFWDEPSGKGVRLGASLEGGRKRRVLRPSGKSIED
jgi:large subunit ribosomal protein L24